VKAAPVATKPFERQTEEEKQDHKDKLAAQGAKSSLKTTQLEKDNAQRKAVSFGKALTYQVGEESEPSQVQDKKVIDEKDIGDGADEREKFLKQQEEEAAKIKEDMRIMNEWKAK